MISSEDHLCISSIDSDAKATIINKDPSQCAKTLLNLLSHVSKDQTIQYILVMIDDLLQEDRSRVHIFHDYASKRKESVWGPFLNLLNRQNGFIVNMASRILAKLACWTHEQMPKSDLHFYLQWLKDQLTLNVSMVLVSILTHCELLTYTYMVHFNNLIHFFVVYKHCKYKKKMHLFFLFY